MSEMNSIVVLEKKKRIVACNECKRRKAKCHGGHPCAWCVANSLECIVAASVQRSEGSKKRRTESPENVEYTVVDTREGSMATNMEMTHYIEVYLKCIDPLFTMLSQWDKGTRLVYFIQPRSHAQFVTKYAACALVARSFGQKARAVQFASHARSISAKCFDEFSLDSLLAFLTLGAYWVSDTKLNMHYANLAVSIFSSLNQNTVPPHIRYFLTITKLLGNTSLSESKKRKMFIAITKAIVVQTQLQSALAAILAVKIKLFSHLKCIDISLLRTDIVSVICGHISFTEEQRLHFLEELKVCKIIASSPEITSDDRVFTTLSILMKVYEVFIEWRSGHPNTALPIAIELASMCNYEALKFGSLPIRVRSDVENLLMLAIFFYEQHHFQLAEKMHHLAEALYNLLSEPLPEISTTFELITAYIRSEYFGKKTKRPEISDENLARVIQKSFADLHQHPIHQLLPVKALHSCFQNFSHFIPPNQSPFKISDALPVAAPFLQTTSYPPSSSSSLSPSPSFSSSMSSLIPSDILSSFAPSVYDISPSPSPLKVSDPLPNTPPLPRSTSAFPPPSSSPSSFPMYDSSPSNSFSGSSDNSANNSPLNTEGVISPTTYTFSTNFFDSASPFTSPFAPSPSPTSSSPLQTSATYFPPPPASSSLPTTPSPPSSTPISPTFVPYFALNPDDTLPIEPMKAFDWFNSVDWNVGV